MEQERAPRGGIWLKKKSTESVLGPQNSITLIFFSLMQLNSISVYFSVDYTLS